MSTARQILALLKSHIEGDDAQFLSVAMQVAAQEARQGHGKIAQELRALIDQAKERKSAVRRTGAIPLAQPKGELAALLSVVYPEVRLAGMVLPSELESRLRRVL